MIAAAGESRRRRDTNDRCSEVADAVAFAPAIWGLEALAPPLGLVAAEPGDHPERSEDGSRRPARPDVSSTASETRPGTGT